MPKSIAIVEDETSIAENYRDALQRSGYKVRLYADRRSALTSFADRLPDMAIIDVGLGDDLDGGFELCRELRSRSPQLPIVFLTARDSDYDAVAGLRLGADDYLSKDISLPHLLARITALFRRLDLFHGSGADNALRPIRRGALVIDTERLSARWHDQHLDLTVTEFWILHALANRPGQVKSRQQLMEAASVVLDDHTITSHIKRIRKKFQQLDPDFAAIETAYGMGYRWLAQTE